MKTTQALTLALVSCLSLTHSTLLAQLVPGNLAVLRVGDGIQTLGSSGNTGFIDQFSTSGSLVNSTRIPDAGSSSIIFSGSAASEGALNLSTDGKALLFAGYNTPQPTTSVASTLSSAVPRVIGVMSSSGGVSIGASTTTQYSANNIRGTAGSSTDFYGAGGNSGTYYFGTSQTPATVQSANANTRFVDIVNGNLYYITASAPTGLYKVGASPTSLTTPTFVTGSSTSPYEFSMNSAENLVYITDDSSTSAGGIKRYDFSGGTWSLTYTLGTGVAGIGARGITVNFSGANPVIYATTAESSANRLIQITDTGSTSSTSLLATAAANEVFRGVDFTPSVASIPEPSTFLFAGAALGAVFAHRRFRFKG